ncbi:MAG TPA: L,D-transpeptidase family protein [Sphingomonas sp.]|uniref:L,D-transpeptidase family protein n=1 Tax=Sphingomonas sp. TaxID=28214 RepID=UPI002BCD1DB1|nr:L,D-transpeptidase family protein [Sphingomonas sp.]HMI19333.1 L,D-transpeptidase family protein [Sphingomonas sp.]
MGIRSVGLGVWLAATALTCLASVSAASASDIAVSTAQAGTHWTEGAARDLIVAIEDSRAEGLHPADYNLAGLKRVATDGEGGALDALATVSALALAHDYYFGRVSDRSDMQWMIQRSPYEAVQLPARLQAAIDDGKVQEFFAALLPSDPHYQALRSALADMPTGAARDRLRVNMERWRWMPRSIATSYLYVNVPSYKLRVVEDGVQLSSYDVVVGAKDTPTPQMVSPTGSFVVNPAWYVPASIARKSGLRAGRGGFTGRHNADGSYTVMQPPGPRNALGRIKFNLENDQAIYLHDTNAKAAFNRDQRALSHGCVRVKDIDQLAAELMSQGQGDPATLEEALAKTQTATLRLPQTWPVYIVYFTADADGSGDITTYGDPYGYDAKVLTALDGKPLQVASN